MFSRLLVVCEFLLEGPLAGSGYLSNPFKTTAAFIEDPQRLLRGRPGYPGRLRQLYRTDDLVRYHPDRSLVY